jgi:flagellar M-ring protein FliF
MKETLTTFFEQVSNTSPATRGVLALAGLVLAASVGVVSYQANQTEFTLLYSELDESRAASIQAALANGGMHFRVSAPPAPYSIRVEEKFYYKAQNAVAIAGALKSAPKGINPSSAGASAVFLSASERAQDVMKREWQEAEKQLEVFEWVARATVTTSIQDTNPLRKRKPVTVAVALRLRGSGGLTVEQVNTVTDIVCFRFGVPRENVVLSDQYGNNLRSNASDSLLAGILEHQSRYDALLASKTNEVLRRILGLDRAYVIVNSEWTHEQTSSIQESLDDEHKVVISEETFSTKTPQGANQSGGAAGVASNIINEYGTNHAATPVAPNASGLPMPREVATTDERRKTTLVGRTTESRINIAPRLSRLTITLFLEDSVKEHAQELEASVKSCVGFDERRGDVFSSTTLRFASLERDDDGAPVVAPVEIPAEPTSPMFEIALERGVEIVAALAFIFVLLKSLKSRGTPVVATNEARPLDQQEDVDRELLARAQVDDLLRTDPQRVSDVLSRWAAEEIALQKNTR